MDDLNCRLITGLTEGRTERTKALDIVSYSLRPDTFPVYVVRRMAMLELSIHDVGATNGNGSSPKR
jgi:hypothetical protein